MTMPQGTDTDREWLGKIELAKWYTEKIGNTDDRWTKYTKALASDFGNSDKDDALDVNMVNPTTQLNLSPLHTSDVYLTIRPTRPTVEIGRKTFDNIERARFTELEINHWIRELEIRQQVIRRCVHDAEISNHAYAYVGMVTEEHGHLLESETQDGPARKLEWNPLIKVDQPFCVRHPFKQILVPPGHVGFNEHPFMVMGFRKPKWVVEEMFPDKDLSDLDPSVDLYEKSDVISTDQNASPMLKEFLESGAARLVQLWQVWDQESQKVMMFAEGWPEMLESGEWPWATEGFPVEHLYFVDVPDEYWGSPPIQMYWPQQRELNWARAAAKKRNNRTKKILAIRKSEVSGAIVAAYKNAEDGAMLEIPGDSENPVKNDIVEIDGIQAPSEHYADGQVQIGDILTITGHGRQQRLGGDPNIDTATESANVDKWALIRSTDRGDRVKSMYLGIGKKIWMVLRDKPNVQRERLVLGKLGQQAVTVRYTLAQLQGDFAWSMDVGSLMGDNPIRRQQMALGNYNLLRQDPEADPIPLITDLLDSQGKPDVAHYLANRDPAEEFKTMQQGFPVEAILRDDHMTHIPEHMAQQEQLARLVESMPDEQLEDAPGLQARMALHLLMAHRAQHMQFVEQITGKPVGESGQPVDPNQLRADLARQPGGPETDAELSGQPQGGGQGTGGLARQVSG